MRLGTALALLGAMLAFGCEDGAAVKNGEAAEPADSVSASSDGIQVSALPADGQEVEPLGADEKGADESAAVPNEAAGFEGAPMASLGNGPDEIDGLQTQLGEATEPLASEPIPNASMEVESDVDSTILEIVVRTQEDGLASQASIDIEAGSLGSETGSAVVAGVEAGSDISEARSGESSAAEATDEPPVDDPASEQPLDGLGTAAVDDDDELSDEQDFEAVSGRETIESDAERLRAQQTERMEFEPVPLPDRIGASNVALFALQTTHDVGTEVYKRTQLFVFEAGVRNRCAEFPDSEAAQQAFLDAGGPEDDELRIDPDGDGFVCGWNPEVYRALLK